MKTSANPNPTDGPWVAVPHEGGGIYSKRFQVRGPDDAGPTAYFVCENAREANARLIAAAPEMLSALRGVAAQLSESLAGLAEWPNAAGWFDILSDCQRAIVKAETGVAK